MGDNECMFVLFVKPHCLRACGLFLWKQAGGGYLKEKGCTLKNRLIRGYIPFLSWCGRRMGGVRHQFLNSSPLAAALASTVMGRLRSTSCERSFLDRSLSR